MLTSFITTYRPFIMFLVPILQILADAEGKCSSWLRISAPAIPVMALKD